MQLTIPLTPAAEARLMALAKLTGRTPENLAATNAHWNSMSQQDIAICSDMSRARQMEVANAAQSK